MTQALAKIPATVITGFLGAGKTTLIRHLLANARGHRLALVINEFGDMGVDRELVRGCGVETCADEDIVELTNGCICCTVADDFLPTMLALVERTPRPDHIVIETSGLALPKPLIKAFDWPEVRTRLTVDGVVTVVDAPAAAAGLFAQDPAAVAAAREADPTIEHDDPLEELFHDQLQAADLVLLNKTDQIDGSGRGAARDAMAPFLRAGVEVVETDHGRIDPAVLLGLGAAAEDDLAARRSVHDDAGEHDHDDFASVHVDLPAVADAAALRARIDRVLALDGVLRAKGFAAVDGRPMRLAIQAVGRRIDTYFDRPWVDGEPRTGGLVVIGLKHMDMAAIAAAFDQPVSAAVA